MNTARIFFQALRVGYTDFTLFWTWKSWIGSWLLRTVSSAMTWVLLGRLVGGERTVEYLLIGNAVLAGPASVCWTIASSTWDRFEGVYPLQVIAPSSLLPSLAGRSFVWVLNGIVTSWVVFAVLALGFDLPFPTRALWLVPPLVVVICLSTFGYSLLVGAFVARAPRLRIMINFGSTNVLMALSGVSVPISFWPAGIRALTTILPVTHGLRAVRLSFAGGALAEIALLSLRELTTGLVWLALAWLVVDKLAASGRRDGSIEFSG